MQSRGRARAKLGQMFLITEEDSFNSRREEENCLNEIEMEKALNELHKLGEDVFKQEFDKCQISKSMTTKTTTVPKVSSDSSLSSISVDNKKKQNPKQYEVHCRECGVRLFNASEIRYREPSYYCMSKEFALNSIRLDEETKKFYCVKESCGKELGRQIMLRRGDPLHMIEIKGIKFAKKGHTSTQFEVYSKWNKVTLEMQIDEINL